MHAGRDMAPKDWSNKVTISDPELQGLLKEHSKVIERLGWKAMDYEEVSEHLLPFLKSLAKATLKVNKAHFRKTMARAHLSLTAAEMHLFVDKICGTITWMKTKLRDMGSGTNLPGSCKIIWKVWKAHHGNAAKMKKEKEKEEKEEEQQKKQNKKKEGQSQSTSPTAGLDIRSVFGLDPVPVVDLVDMGDSSEDSEPEVDLEDTPPAASSSRGAHIKIESLHGYPCFSLICVVLFWPCSPLP